MQNHRYFATITKEFNIHGILGTQKVPQGTKLKIQPGFHPNRIDVCLSKCGRSSCELPKDCYTISDSARKWLLEWHRKKSPKCICEGCKKDQEIPTKYLGNNLT